MQQQQPSMMLPIPIGANPMTHLPSMMGPPPPPPHHHMPQHHPRHHQQGPIPLAMIARINADIDNQLQMQEQQQIEEHIIPIFQQLLPELRQSPDNGEHLQQEQQQHKQQQQQQQQEEAEDRAMPNKVLYHPAMAEGRSLYTVAISDNKPSEDGLGMMPQNAPSEARSAPMFQRVPINVPLSMMMPPQGAGPMIQQDSNDEPKPDHRPHCEYTLSTFIYIAQLLFFFYKINTLAQFLKTVGRFVR